MAKSGSDGQAEKGNGSILEFPENDSVPLSQEEIDALLEIDIENSEVNEVDDLVTDALVAKLVLHKTLVRMWGDFPIEHWRGYYTPLADKFKSSLNIVIAESDADFSDTQRERLAKMGIVTFRDLCLLSVEELRKADFGDFEIKSIQNILYRLELWLMG